MDFNGILYRALNPLWARVPLSGEGAARFGGRFNPKGLAALYTSLRPETAMREANQVGAFQPITLVAYRAALEHDAKKWAPVFCRKSCDNKDSIA